MTNLFQDLTTGNLDELKPEINHQDTKGEQRAGSSRQSSVVSRQKGARYYYALSLLLFALALMAKPMAVTLPCVLLLLDFWPLRRVAGGKAEGRGQTTEVRSKEARDETGDRRPEGGQESVVSSQWAVGSGIKELLVEKIPFFVLAAISCAVTIKAQGESVVPMDYVPAGWRIANCLTAVALYLGKLAWPVHLAIYYPFVKIPLWETLAGGLLLALLTLLFLKKWRTAPALPTGWLWFLVMLVPVIGIVQVSVQAMADRYTYLPAIGIFIAAVWGAADLTARLRFGRTLQLAGAAAVLGACLWLTRWQLGYWRDSVTLFTRAVEVSGENPLGNLFLGNACLEQGDLDGAVRNYRIVLRTAPDSEDVHYRIGFIRQRQKHWPEAETEFNEVLRLNPNNGFAHKFLGDARSAREKYTEAAAAYAAAQQLLPDDRTIQAALAANAQRAEIQKALDPLLAAAQARPTAETEARIAALRELQGFFQAAADHYAAALRLEPDAPQTLNNLAWLLTTCPDPGVRDGRRAVALARRACELTGFQKTIFIGTLAAAQAGAGKFDEAAATAQRACELASKNGEADLLRTNQELMKRYQEHRTAGE